MQQEEINQRAYENIKDMIYAEKDVDPSVQERILQGSRVHFNVKAIELE